MTMGTSKQSGFTVIEVTLFLAVSGLLIVGLFMAVGASLNEQRYRDATQTFKSLLQEQYSDLANTQNSRSNNWSCNDSNATVGTATSVFRGQTNCMLVGKYMTIDKGDIKIYTVVATEKAITNPSLSDISALRSSGNYRLNISTTGVETTSLEWGTELAWPASGSGARTPRERTMGLLFIRSPDSGRTYTFTSDSLINVPSGGVAATAFDDILQNSDTIPGRRTRTLCVYSDGLGRGGDQAITLRAYADSASAVETRTNEYMKANSSSPSPVQC